MAVWGTLEVGATGESRGCEENEVSDENVREEQVDPAAPQQNQNDQNQNDQDQNDVENRAASDPGLQTPDEREFEQMLVEEKDQTDRREQELQALVSERTADLQRLQAEYVNYKKRVDRDRAHARQAGVESVVTELLPVLDSIDMARQHDDLGDGFKLVAEALEKLAGKHGLHGFGEVGDPFDPKRHDALMQVPMDGVEVTTCSQIMQRGYELHGRVIRPARVAVAEPN
ncbi:Protein GrpE [Aestuariimicrobium sp. T2.26MG-19.2B]|nr:Protein GrpE [Aestuariimicrobium sp. T2.26MG-19.2B]